MSEAYIKTLEDMNGNIIYPQTKTEAIYDNNGVTLHQSISDTFGEFEQTTSSNINSKMSELDTQYDDFYYEVGNALGNKSNKVFYSPRTLYSSGWTNGKYSFETEFPASKYDITVEVNGDTATALQMDAFSGAKILGSATSNMLIAIGDVPTIDIPIILSYTKIVDNVVDLDNVPVDTTTISTHMSNSAIHVTLDEKQAWNRMLEEWNAITIAENEVF